jgi:hypothetical protein
MHRLALCLALLSGTLAAADVVPSVEMSLAGDWQVKAVVAGAGQEAGAPRTLTATLDVARCGWKEFHHKGCANGFIAN